MQVAWLAIRSALPVSPFTLTCESGSMAASGAPPASLPLLWCTSFECDGEPGLRKFALSLSLVTRFASKHYCRLRCRTVLGLTLSFEDMLSGVASILRIYSAGMWVCHLEFGQLFCHVVSSSFMDMLAVRIGSPNSATYMCEEV